MLYCYDERIPLDSFKKEIELAIKKNKAIFYDKEIGFIDGFGNKVDIEGKTIMPRTFVSTIDQINEAIIRNGGLLALSKKDDEKILNWPRYYQPKRKVFTLKGEDLIKDDVVRKLRECFGDNIFLKTKEKNFNSVIPVSLLEDKECNFCKALLCSLDTEFIVSRAVSLIEDEYGVREYRCFVIDGEVANISRYTEDVLHTIDQEVLDKAKELVNNLKGTLPSCYVMDLFEYDNAGTKEIDVVEFNPFHSSGIYLYNSAIDKSNDLLHRDNNDISYEYRDRVSQCVEDGLMINERNPLYKIYGTFANKLLSICVSGVESGGLFTDVKVTKSDYASHKPILNFSLSSSITSESGIFSLIGSDEDLKSSSVSKSIVTPNIIKSCEGIVIGTSCYQNAHGGNMVSITGDGGNAWGFFGPAYKKLAPSWKLYEYWRDNPDGLSDIELIEYYIKDYFYHRLEKLNTKELLYQFKERFGKEIILLCHELPSESDIMSKEHFCHRRVDADFIELTTGIVIPEISIDENGDIKYHKQPDYKPMLKKLMK